MPLNAKLKRTLTFVLRIALSILFLTILISRKDISLKEVIQHIRDLDYGFIFWAFFSTCIAYFFCFLRWHKLLLASDIKIKFKRVIVSFLGAMFFSLFLPSTIGGDVARSLDLGIHTQQKSRVVATVLLDRLSGFTGLVIIALFSLILGYLLGYKYINDTTIILSVFLLLAILLAVIVIIFEKGIYKMVQIFLNKGGRLRDALVSLHTEIFLFRHRPVVLVYNLFLSILIQGGSCIAYYFIFKALHVNINIVDTLILFPIVTVISMLPISIGGLGLRDMAVVTLFAKIGIPRDVAFTSSQLNFYIALILGLIGGLVYVSTFHYRRIQHHQK